VLAWLKVKKLHPTLFRVGKEQFQLVTHLSEVLAWLKVKKLHPSTLVP
jgi:hypothetical protein